VIFTPVFKDKLIDDSGGPGMRHLGLRAWARPAPGGGTVSSGPALGRQVAPAAAGHPGRGMGRAGLEVVIACAAFVVLCVAVLSVAGGPCCAAGSAGRAGIGRRRGGNVRAGDLVLPHHVEPAEPGPGAASPLQHRAAALPQLEGSRRGAPGARYGGKTGLVG
jgi:hypothetical protein